MSTTSIDTQLQQCDQLIKATETLFIQLRTYHQHLQSSNNGATPAPATIPDPKKCTTALTQAHRHLQQLDTLLEATYSDLQDQQHSSAPHYMSTAQSVSAVSKQYTGRKQQVSSLHQQYKQSVVIEKAHQQQYAAQQRNALLQPTNGNSNASQKVKAAAQQTTAQTARDYTSSLQRIRSTLSEELQKSDSATVALLRSTGTLGDTVDELGKLSTQTERAKKVLTIQQKQERKEKWMISASVIFFFAVVTYIVYKRVMVWLSLGYDIAYVLTLPLTLPVTVPLSALRSVTSLVTGSKTSKPSEPAAAVLQNTQVQWNEPQKKDDLLQQQQVVMDRSEYERMMQQLATLTAQQGTTASASVDQHATHEHQEL